MQRTGDQVAAHRKKLGYSQEELSQRSGISLRTIQRLESGTVQPRGYTLRALAESLQVPLDDLQQVSANPLGDEANKVARTLNGLGLLVVVFPLGSCLIQIAYWVRHKRVLADHEVSKRVVSFQILWLIAALLCMVLVHLLTYLITGQRVYGHFPSHLLLYSLLVLGNVVYTIHSALQMNRNTASALRHVPSLL